jgi:hypothetical protein
VHHLLRIEPALRHPAEPLRAGPGAVEAEEEVEGVADGLGTGVAAAVQEETDLPDQQRMVGEHVVARAQSAEGGRQQVGGQVVGPPGLRRLEQALPPAAGRRDVVAVERGERCDGLGLHLVAVPDDVVDRRGLRDLLHVLEELRELLGTAVVVDARAAGGEHHAGRAGQGEQVHPADRLPVEHLGQGLGEEHLLVLEERRAPEQRVLQPPALPVLVPVQQAEDPGPRVALLEGALVQRP